MKLPIWIYNIITANQIDKVIKLLTTHLLSSENNVFRVP